jgi:acyl carrier protein
VIHAAGVLRDALIRGGGAAAGCGEVWNAKALSAWWLHKHTAEDKLKYFVTYSSLTAAVGNIGQAAYGAANRYLDALVAERRKAGESGLSIRWPAVAGKGMAAKLLDKMGIDDNVDTSGMFIPSEYFELCLKQYLLGLYSNTGIFAVAPCSVNHKSKQDASSSWKVDPLFDLGKSVRDAVTSCLGDMDESEDDISLQEYGLDSFSAVAIASELSSALKVAVSVDLIYEAGSIANIKDRLEKFVFKQVKSNESSDEATSQLFRKFQHVSSPVGRVFVLPALGSPAIAWRGVSSLFATDGYEMYVLSLPGRYERQLEEAINSVVEVIERSVQVSNLFITL